MVIKLLYVGIFEAKFIPNSQSILSLLLLLLLLQEETKDSSGISHKVIGNTESHLKYENDRLKMALAQR